MFSFDGTSIAPVACMVRPWVDDDIDLLNVREQACVVHVGNFNEVWWFFPQNGQPYNTRAIIYSYKEGWWSQGQMARSAGITVVLHRAHHHGRRPRRLSSMRRATSIRPSVRLAVGRDVRPQPHLRRAADHGQADDPRRRGRHRATLQLFAVLPQLAQPGRARAANAAAPGALATAMSTSAPRAATSGSGSSSRAPYVNPVTVGQHLIDSVPRGDR